MHTLRKLSLYIVLFLSSIQIAQAGREPEIKQVLPRSGVTFAVNNTAVTYDAVLLQSNGIPTGISPSMYNLFNVKNMVYLDIDQSQINHFYITQFSVSVDIEITLVDSV